MKTHPVVFIKSADFRDMSLLGSLKVVSWADMMSSLDAKHHGGTISYISRTISRIGTDEHMSAIGTNDFGFTIGHVG